jgi:hypothetical protein
MDLLRRRLGALLLAVLLLLLPTACGERLTGEFDPDAAEEEEENGDEEEEEDEEQDLIDGPLDDVIDEE